MPSESNNQRAGQAPFDAIATDYDAAFTQTPVGRMQRDIVWKLSAPLISGGLALELNCGTGEDAIWLAAQGYQVLATDISPAMTAIAREKIEKAGLKAVIHTQTAGIDSIATNQTDERYDLIFSNFGGINCLDPKSLQRLGQALPRLLKPGGRLIAVIMGRFCWWETIYFLTKGRFRAAFRRFSRKAVSAQLDDSTTIDTWYYNPNELTTILLSIQLLQYTISVHPVGFYLPPSYLNPFFEKRPRLLNFLNRLEQQRPTYCSPFGADHYLLHIQSKITQ
jgi:SAM-dependent methyltransferase